MAEPPGVPDAVGRALLELERQAPRDVWKLQDPIRFPHRYAAREDREIVALVAALLAFGSVRAFLPKVDALLDAMGPSPRRFVERFGPSSAASVLRDFRSRVYDGNDLRLLFAHLRALLDEFPSLEDAFLSGAVSSETFRSEAVESEPVEPGTSASREMASGRASHRERLVGFACRFLRLDPGLITGSRGFTPGYRHLVADPRRGSPCKRWNLFLRWVVRPADGVDLGLWRRVDPADLVIPMDLHVGRISLLLGLRKRRTLDWKAAEEVTSALRALDSRDPLRFDFSLSHLGISEGCRGTWWKDSCVACRIRGICTVGRPKDGPASGSRRRAGGNAGTERSRVAPVGATGDDRTGPGRRGAGRRSSRCR